MEAKPKVGSSTAPTLPLTQEFDHHCKWVNNCIGHSNFRVFMLLVQSLCLYSDAMLVTCLIFLVRTIHLPFTTDKIIVYQSGCGAPLGRGGQGGDNNGLGHGGEASGGRGSREKPPGDPVWEELMVVGSGGWKGLGGSGGEFRI